MFDPSRSNIQIEMEGIPEMPVPKIKDTCDACGGDPRCIKVCPACVITWDKEGDRKGIKHNRPGKIKRFFQKMNPFSKTGPVCDTPCGAYPDGCQTCDVLNTEPVNGEKGEAA